MGSAIALVYPSLFEGFGIPIVEAFQAEIPVITSNTTSMPEVAGDAAILVEPTDANQLAQALHSLDTNPQLREQLVERGRKRRTLFSWEITADKLWQSMMKTYQSATNPSDK